MRLPSFLLLVVALTPITCGPPKGDHDEEGGSRWEAVAREPSSTPEEAARASTANAIKTVFVIAMENHDWDDIAGSTSAPYINGTLLRIGAHAERYRSDVHPSEPNYVWLEAGDRLGIYDDDDPWLNYRTTRFHLTAQLDTARIPWRAYAEGATGDTCPLASSGKYAATHVPMVFFDDITGGHDEHALGCVGRLRPYTELARDLEEGRVGRYNFITPDLCSDMHDAVGCPSIDTVANGDAFLARTVPMIMDSAAYKDGGVIFVVWDESESRGDPPIGLLAISSLAKPGHAGTVPYNHSSLLRTLQDILGVRPYIRAATDAVPVSDLFVQYP